MTSIQIGGVRPQRSRLPLRDTDGEGARSRGRSAERVSLVAGERMLMLAEALFNMLEVRVRRTPPNGGVSRGCLASIACSRANLQEKMFSPNTVNDVSFTERQSASVRF